MPDSLTNEALKAYQKIYPEFNFPDHFPETEMLSAIQKSLGRRIIITKSESGFKVFFEDNEESLPEIPKWNKLIGCGG